MVYSFKKRWLRAVPLEAIGVAAGWRGSSECSGKYQYEPEKVHNGHVQQHVAEVLDSSSTSFVF